MLCVLTFCHFLLTHRVEVDCLLLWLSGCRLGVPRLPLSQEFGELWLEYTEFVAPRVTHDPELKAAFSLVIPSLGAECFEALNLGFDIIGF